MGLQHDGGPSVAAHAPRRTFRPAAGAFAALLCVAAAVAPVSASSGDLVSRYQAGDAARLGAAANVRLSATAPVTRTITLARAVAPGARCRLVIELRDVTFSSPPPVAYDVYVNLPHGAVPRGNDPHHVGSLTFYGLDGKASPRGSQALGQLIDVTPAARASAERGTIAVTFVPFALVEGGAGAPKPSTDATIGRIEVRAIAAP